MEIQFRLNGKQVTKEVAADAILLNVLRDLGCTSVNVKRRTAVCVRYGWMRSRDFPAQYWQHLWRDTA